MIAKNAEAARLEREIEALKKQVELLKQIISGLTANDDEPLPFAGEG